jgi:V8-like Glu-specific endopeptidase
VTFRIGLLGLVFAGVGAVAGLPPAPVPQLVSERAVVTHPVPAPHGRTAGVSGAGPARGAAWTGGGLVARTTGRVFFTMGGVGYACSGSTVGGASPSVVVTAAHCVSDGAGAWAAQWRFVPGYRAGRAPYGVYRAATFYVARGWASGADENDDVAFVVTRPVAAGGRAVGTVAGEQPVSFGPRGGPAAVFGYPALRPYDGSRLDYCTGRVSPDPYGGADAGLSCAMTEGDSGGPWLSSFNPRTGAGTITGVTTFKYSGESRMLYSANLGSVAQALYTRAEHP